MQPLLSALPELRVRLTAPGLALVVDIDGTISRIASTPQEARVDPVCRRALVSLTSRLTLAAALSGRPAAEAATLVDAQGMVYMGNHGLERWQDGEVFPNPAAVALQWAVDTALERLRKLLERPGIFIEHKGLTGSIHYRLSPQPGPSRKAILNAALEATAGLPVQVREGRMVVEVRPAVEAHKGTAMLQLLEESEPASALYLGDDRTDVDAFRALRQWAQRDGRWGAAVAVVGNETPSEVIQEADYFLEGVAQAGVFLNWLAQLSPQTE